MAKTLFVASLLLVAAGIGMTSASDGWTPSPHCSYNVSLFDRFHPQHIVGRWYDDSGTDMQHSTTNCQEMQFFSTKNRDGLSVISGHVTFQVHYNCDDHQTYFTFNLTQISSASSYKYTGYSQQCSSTWVPFGKKSYVDVSFVWTDYFDFSMLYVCHRDRTTNGDQVIVQSRKQNVTPRTRHLLQSVLANEGWTAKLWEQDNQECYN